MTVIAFGGTTLLDTAARLFADEPMAILHTTAYGAPVPLRASPLGVRARRGDRDRPDPRAPAVIEIATGYVADLIAGSAFFLLCGALGASVRYRTGSRLRERDQVRLREREQLARELHDTVAHHVSAIAIRAQAGRTLAATRPEAAVDALEVIEEAASRALSELRAIVGALRDGDEADLAPQRGVADLARLAAPPTGRAWTSRSRATSRACGRWSAPPSTGSRRSRSPTRSATRAARHGSTSASPASRTACG